MLEINESIRIPDDEFAWSFVRSGGPGGQNVNKVASKAVLRWNVNASPSLPEDMRARFQTQKRSRITLEGDIVVTSQRYRDQERNKQDCLEKLREYLLQATVVPKVRRKAKPSRASKERRLGEKRQRAATKLTRRKPVSE
jgi:ribosome-associated protein